VLLEYQALDLAENERSDLVTLVRIQAGLSNPQDDLAHYQLFVCACRSEGMRTGDEKAAGSVSLCPQAGSIPTGPNPLEYRSPQDTRIR
jgi:hypothetical protein